MARSGDESLHYKQARTQPRGMYSRRAAAMNRLTTNKGKNFRLGLACPRERLECWACALERVTFQQFSGGRCLGARRVIQRAFDSNPDEIGHSQRQNNPCNKEYSDEQYIGQHLAPPRNVGQWVSHIFLLLL